MIGIVFPVVPWTLRVWAVLTRVLLVDNSADLLRSTKNLLATSDDVEVIGCATSCREALECVSRMHPDLVLVDVTMGDMSGIEATRRMKAEPRPPLVVLTTLYDESRYEREAMAAGADGLVAKPELGTRLLPIIRVLTSSEPTGTRASEGSDISE